MSIPQENPRYVEITEKSGLFSSETLYLFKESGERARRRTTYDLCSKKEIGQGSGKWETNTVWSKLLRPIMHILCRSVLPVGFPESVANGYLRFQFWDSLQNIASALQAAFSTQASLKALGVGNTDASALSAATITLIRQGIDYFGQLMLGWAKGRAFGYNNKKWRIFADIAHDTREILFMLSAMVPPWAVVYVFSVAGFINSLETISGIASRISVVQHFAIANNIADCYAKETTQANVVNLLFVGVTIYILPLVDGNTMLVWLIFGLCVMCHIFANYNGIKTLQYKSLNDARLLICLKQFLKDGTVPSIQKTNREESVFLGLGITAHKLLGFRIKLGVSVMKGMGIYPTCHATPVDVNAILKLFEGKRFLIVPDPRRRCMKIILHEDITAKEVIEAYCRAVFEGNALKEMRPKARLAPENSSSSKQWDEFLAALESKKYDVHQMLLKFGDHRATWSTPDKDDYSIPTNVLCLK